jgi:hypothetical protein
MAGGAEPAAPAAAPAEFGHVHVGKLGIARQDLGMGRSSGLLVHCRFPDPNWYFRDGRGDGGDGRVRIVGAGIEVRHVAAGKGSGEFQKQLFPEHLRSAGREPLAEQTADGRQHRLGLADNEAIDKGSERFRVDKGGHAAGHDERPAAIILGPVGGERGDTAGEQDFYEVNKVMLEADREEQKREIAWQPARFDRGRRTWTVREKDAFANDIEFFVQQPVDELQSQVGHADCIPVGIDEADRQSVFPLLFPPPGLASQAMSARDLLGAGTFSLHRLLICPDSSPVAALCSG